MVVKVRNQGAAPEKDRGRPHPPSSRRELKTQGLRVISHRPEDRVGVEGQQLPHGAFLCVSSVDDHIQECVGQVQEHVIPVESTDIFVTNVLDGERSV